MKEEKMLKKVVKGVLFYWIIFVSISWVKGSVPDTLIQIGLGGGAFELLCSTIIEVAHKKFEGDNTNE